MDGRAIILQFFFDHAEQQDTGCIAGSGSQNFFEIGLGRRQKAELKLV